MIALYFLCRVVLWFFLGFFLPDFFVSERIHVAEALQLVKTIATADMDITPTPTYRGKRGEIKGSGNQVDVEKSVISLIERHFRKLLQADGDRSKLPSKVRLKYEGDGCPVSRQRSLCLLNVLLLDDEDSVFSAKGREILGCVTGHEAHSLWKICFGNIINKINTLKRVTVMGITVELDCYLGGDYKFLLQVCGLTAAYGNHACLYCYVHKDFRGIATAADAAQMKRNLPEGPPVKIKLGRGAKHSLSAAGRG